jgi:hypothetical protein
MKKIKLLALSFFGLLANSCSTGPRLFCSRNKKFKPTFKIYTGFPETFESGSKTSYVADITLTGIWNLNDALIGTLSGDRKRY